MTLPLARADPAASPHYWRRIFQRNPNFCSWQTPRQQQVRAIVHARLREIAGPLRLLDFGIGSMGLYRSFDDDGLLRRICLLGISESQQHDENDPLLARYHIRIAIGPGLTPLAQVPEASQDLVVCTYVFAYLSPTARAEALQAFARVLAPGGRLLLVLHHARGERARKFQRSEPYWRQARKLYEYLLEGRHDEARTLMADLTGFLDVTFAADPRYQRYLASYLGTAGGFLAAFGAGGESPRPVPEEALSECALMKQWTERELAMTCKAFNPVENPATDLALPAELALRGLVECADPTTGAPMANVLTAVKVEGPAPAAS